MPPELTRLFKKAEESRRIVENRHLCGGLSFKAKEVQFRFHKERGIYALDTQKMSLFSRGTLPKEV